jgi:hypothetical protein
LLEAAGLATAGAAAIALLSPLVVFVPTDALGAARVVARLLLLVSVVAPLLAVLLPAWRRTGSLLDLARAVDARVPETRNSLWTAVDLQQAASAGAFTGHAERSLLDRHLADAASATNHVAASTLLPARSLGARTAAGPALLGLLALLATFGPSGLSEGWSRLFGPPAAVAEATAEEGIDVADLTLRNLRLELTPPAYSGRESLVLDGTTGDFQALAGTRVGVTAGVGRTGGKARLVVSGADPTDAELSGKRLDGSFTVPGGGFWRVEVDRGLGGVSRSRKFRIELVPDRPPELQVTAPAVKELRPEESLALDINTRDDFGLSRVDLVVERRGRPIARQTIMELGGAPAFEGRNTFVPREWIGEQGGELELVVESWDNDTVQGPKVTRSRAVEVYVPTARDHHNKVLALKQQLLGRTIDLLALILVDAGGVRGRIEASTVLGQHALHRTGMDGVQQTGRALTLAMTSDTLEDRAVYLGTVQLLENLARSWQPLDDLVADRVAGRKRVYVDGSTLMEIGGARVDLVDELERVILDLDAFVSLHQGGDALDSISDLEPSAAQVADLLRQAQDGKPVSAELAAAFEALQKQLAEVAQALLERSGGPDDGFLNQLPEQIGEDRMAQIQKAIDEGRFEDAMELMQEAMEAIAATEEALQSEAQDMAGAQVADAVRQKLQEGIDQVRELEAQQQAVIEGTEGLQERFGSGDGLEEDAFAEIDQAIQALRDGIDDLPPESLGGPDGGAVRSWERMALRQAMRLQEAWDEGALREAADHAEMTGADLAEMARELGNTDQGVRADNAAAEDRALEARARAEDIAQKLQSAVAQASRSRQQAGAASEGIQGQQQSVAEGAGELAEKMGKMGGSAFNPAGGRQQLGGAQQLMERAGSQLRQGRTGRAVAAEQDALKQLQAYRESLEGAQQAMQPGQRMGGGQGSPRPGGFAQQPGDGQGLSGDTPQGGDVELSDPDDFLSPEALRALLQEGAADDAPERYKPVNRGYYEELAR